MRPMEIWELSAGCYPRTAPSALECGSRFGARSALECGGMPPLSAAQAPLRSPRSPNRSVRKRQRLRPAALRSKLSENDRRDKEENKEIVERGLEKGEQVPRKTKRRPVCMRRAQADKPPQSKARARMRPRTLDRALAPVEALGILWAADAPRPGKP